MGIFVAAATCLGAVPAQAAAVSDPYAPSAAPVSSSPPVGQPGSIVVHYGYSPGGKPWSTGVLDASTAFNRDARNFAPRPASTGQSVQSAAVGFLCSMTVSTVTLSANALHSTSFTTCTGAFKNQYVGAKFQRDAWNGWHDYSSTGTTPTSNATHITYVWSIGCNIGGDKNGSYNYRLYAISFAQSSEDGTWHNGSPVASDYGTKYACGTGIS